MRTKIIKDHPRGERTKNANKGVDCKQGKSTYRKDQKRSGTSARRNNVAASRVVRSGGALL